jgi:rhodanese-related sulfurtransferase
MAVERPTIVVCERGRQPAAASFALGIAGPAKRKLEVLSRSLQAWIELECPVELGRRVCKYSQVE